MDNPSEKYALIYEFNNESPLFARVANQYININKFEEAITILEKGIFEYPEYPTAYFLYAIALANCGESTQAKEMVQKATDLHGTTESLKYYMDLIENINLDYTEDEVENKIDIDEEKNEIVTEQEETEMVIDVEKNNIVIKEDEDGVVIDEDENEIVIGLEQNNNEMDDDLGALAEKLTSAVIHKIDDDEVMPEEFSENDVQFQGKSLVSETLAKIYFNQGNYKQALSIYETLIDIQPEKKDYYEEMITQIKDKI